MDYQPSKRQWEYESVAGSRPIHLDCASKQVRKTNESRFLKLIKKVIVKFKKRKKNNLSTLSRGQHLELMNKELRSKESKRYQWATPSDQS